MSFTQAQAAGYTLEQIMEMIMKNYPQIGKKIKQARNLGYDAKQLSELVKKLSPDILEKEERKGVYNSDNPYINADRKGNEQSAYHNIGKYTKPAAQAAAGFALSTMVPWGSVRNIAGSVIPPIPSMPNSTPPQNQQTPPIVPRGTQQGIEPTPSPQMQTPGQTIGQEVHAPGGIPNVPQPPVQSQQPQKSQVNSQSIIQQMGLEDKIKNMKQAGNPPEQIGQAIEVMAKPEQKKWLQTQTDQPLSQIVNDYLSQKPSQMTENATNIPQEMSENTRNGQKANLIATKNGDIGTLKGEDSTGKLIDVDGRVKKYKDDEVIESPLPEKDMADLLDDLVGGIEKQTGKPISKHVAWAGYDSEHNELQYRPHAGASYTFTDIEPEDLEFLKSHLLRKTSGNSIIGAWEEGTESPFGAQMSALIQKYKKRDEKGKGYARKYETLIDWLEPATTQKKEKQKQQKENAKRKK